MEGLVALVVAESLQVAQDLNLAFRRHPSVTVLGPAFDERAARETLADGTVDVVVVDLERTDEQGLGLVMSLRAAAPVPVIATASLVDASLIAQVLAAGGSGLLPRAEEPRRLIEILRAAAVGEIALPEGHLNSVVEHLHTARAERQREAIAALTPRERQVLTLLCEGCSIADMAQSLGVSGSTVQAHLKAMFVKLGVHSQVDAVRAAWRCGIGIPVSA